MKEEMKTKLMPLYEEMLSKFKNRSNLTTFSARWGKEFPREKGKGILFVGRVVNGGKANAHVDVNTLLDENIKDGIEWVEKNMKQLPKQKKYNVNNSAFWRTIRGITQNLYQVQDNWTSKIAWSNLYKVSPYKKGNPNSKQEQIQSPYCEAILKAEIEILQPQFVVFLTSRNVNHFIWNNYGLTRNSIKPYFYLKKNKPIKLYKISDMYFITSYHPQGKPEKKQINIISDMIKDKLIL